VTARSGVMGRKPVQDSAGSACPGRGSYCGCRDRAPGCVFMSSRT